jgi:nitroreductase
MKSLNNVLYPAIFTRKSTRGYTDAPVTEEKLHGLRSFMQEVVPLLPSEAAAFDIQTHTAKTMKISAYAKNEATAYINLAFMLQQMDLYLQLNGIGALWNGTVRATVKQQQGLPYGICLVFGMAKENPARADISQFKRKRAEEITNTPELPFIEAVRLAPSARNSQPWYLSCEDGLIDFYYKKGGLLDNTLLKGMHWLDIGIAACHAVLALQQQGCTPVAAMRPDAKSIDGCIYRISLHIKDDIVIN